MKKNKFRSNSNYNNQGYSLSYKFDSVSPAGKCSGTALDLIKRYNDLAKEAHGNGDYVEAEVFRQYAEHYRKIVTEINERKQRFENNRETSNVVDSSLTANTELAEQAPIAAVREENTEDAAQNSEVSDNTPSLVETKAKKSFKVIEITNDAPKARRTYKTRAKSDNQAQAENA